jgi:hypothetical protein
LAVFVIAITAGVLWARDAKAGWGSYYYDTSYGLSWHFFSQAGGFEGTGPVGGVDNGSWLDATISGHPTLAARFTSPAIVSDSNSIRGGLGDVRISGSAPTTWRDQRGIPHQSPWSAHIRSEVTGFYAGGGTSVAEISFSQSIDGYINPGDELQVSYTVQLLDGVERFRWDEHIVVVDPGPFHLDVGFAPVPLNVIASELQVIRDILIVRALQPNQPNEPEEVTPAYGLANDATYARFAGDFIPVSEPSSLVITALGLIAVAVLGLRRRKTSTAATRQPPQHDA